MRAATGCPSAPRCSSRRARRSSTGSTGSPTASRLRRGRPVAHADTAGRPRAVRHRAPNVSPDATCTAGAAVGRASTALACRTVRAPGRITKRSGGSMVRASPSTPISTGPPDVTSNSVGGPLVPAREPADLAGGLERGELLGIRRAAHQHRHDAEPAGVEARPRGGAPQVRELVGVVRHEHEVAPTSTCSPDGKGEPQVERHRGRADQVGQRLGGRAQLGVAVLLRLHDLGVHAHRRVVHEDAAVDLGEVDHAGRRRRRRRRGHRPRRRGPCPRSRAKWLRVPAGITTIGMPCRLATEATSACEPSPPAMPMTSAPRATASSASASRSEPCVEHDRLDAALAAEPLELEPLRLPAAGPRVHDEHRVARAGAATTACAGSAVARPQRDPRRRGRDRGQERAPTTQHPHALAGDHHDGEEHQGDGPDRERDEPRVVPRRRHREPGRDDQDRQRHHAGEQDVPPADEPRRPGRRPRTRERQVGEPGGQPAAAGWVGAAARSPVMAAPLAGVRRRSCQVAPVSAM